MGILLLWLLASGFWLLASGFWLPASGFWLLASGFWLLASFPQLLRRRLFRRWRWCRWGLHQIFNLYIEIIEDALRNDLNRGAVGRLCIDSFRTLALRAEGDSRQVVRTLPEDNFQPRFIQAVS